MRQAMFKDLLGTNEADTCRATKWKSFASFLFICSFRFIINVDSSNASVGGDALDGRYKRTPLTAAHLANADAIFAYGVQIQCAF